MTLTREWRSGELLNMKSMKWDLNTCQRLNWLRRRRNRSTFRQVCLVQKNKKKGKVYKFSNTN